MNPLLAQLYAMRAQLEAAIAILEQEMPPEQTPQGCQHPEGRQRNASTFGEPNMLICLDCGAKHPGSVG